MLTPSEIYDKWMADQPTETACDTETYGLAYQDRAFAITLDWGQGGVYLDLRDPEAVEVARAAFATEPRLIFHNAKFDIQKLQFESCVGDRVAFEDTEAIAHLLDEHRPKRLKYLAKVLLGELCLEDEALKATRRKLKLKKSDGFHLIPNEILAPYAIKDAEYTWHLYKLLAPALQRYDDLSELYQLEKSLMWVLLDMERRGLRVDRERVQGTCKRYAGNVLRAELAARDAAGREDFNANSNPQIRDYFESKGIVREKYDKANLVEIEDPMAQALVELRSASKIHNTYLLPMLAESIEDSILHPNFRQHGTKTGRMSSGQAEN